MKKVILLITILLAIGSYIWFKNKNETVIVPVQNTATSTPQVKMTRDNMVGTWQSGASDSGSVTLTLESTGNFSMKEIYSYSEAGDYPEGYEFPEPTKTEGSGRWSVETKDGQPYLSLKFDKDFKSIPDTPVLINQYKSWGQEFVGKNEIRVWPEYQKNSSALMFRYDGYLMEKSK